MFPRIALSLMGVVGVGALLACSQTDVAQTSVTAEIKSTESARSSAEQSEQADTKAAIKAYIDPTTGELRDPTAEEQSVAAVTDKKAQSINHTVDVPPSREVVHSDGIVELPMDASKQRALRACVQKDGTMKMDHDCGEAQSAERKRVE